MPRDIEKKNAVNRRYYRRNRRETTRLPRVIIWREEAVRFKTLAQELNVSLSEAIRLSITWTLEDWESQKKGEMQSAVDTQTDNPRLHTRGNGDVS